MSDHAPLIYPQHGEGATSDLDNAEAYLLYEINLHLHFETNQKHYGYQNTNLFNLYASSKEIQLYTVIY